MKIIIIKGVKLMLLKYLFEDSVAREKIQRAEKDVKELFVNMYE